MPSRLSLKRQPDLTRADFTVELPRENVVRELLNDVIEVIALLLRLVQCALRDVKRELHRKLCDDSTARRRCDVPVDVAYENLVRLCV